ncbi:MAG: RNA 2',3'-cyclic phosphodiesterase [Halobacteriota archaeon]
MMSSNSIRAFIGIDLDSETQKRLLAIQRDKLKLDQFSSVKTVNPKMAHITLGFLGNKTSSELSLIVEALRSISFHPLCLTLCGIGVFPNMKRMRVIHVGMRDSKDAKTLHELILKALKGKHKPGKQKFDPHITLGRVKRIIPEELTLLTAAITPLSTSFIGQLKVTSFQLKKSTLTSTGPIYETLGEFQL